MKFAFVVYFHSDGYFNLLALLVSSDHTLNSSTWCKGPITDSGWWAVLCGRLVIVHRLLLQYI